MTCVVALVHKKRIYMACDSAGTDYNFNQIIRLDPKIYKNGDILIGFCGSYRMGQLLGFTLTPPAPWVGQKPENYMVSELIPAIRQTLKDGGYAKVENSVEEGGTFLVGYSGRLFQVEGDFQVGESADRFDACGAGAQVAIGVLHATRNGANPRARLQAALEAASRYNASVRPPFVFESL